MSVTGDWDRRISRRTLLRTGGSFAAVRRQPVRARCGVVPTVRQRGVPATTLATFAVENGKPGAVSTSV